MHDMEFEPSICNRVKVLDRAVVTGGVWSGDRRWNHARLALIMKMGLWCQDYSVKRKINGDYY